MTGLEDIIKRLENPQPFLKRVLEDVCFRCIRTLQEHSPGTRLPLEWTLTYTVSGQSGTATIFHRWLEADRETWEVVFHAHNHGSRRHFIAPRSALALSWVDDGVRYFSKGHYVSGVQARHFAERTDRVIADFERALPGKWQRWLNTGVYS